MSLGWSFKGYSHSLNLHKYHVQFMRERKDLVKMDVFDFESLASISVREGKRIIGMKFAGRVV